VAILTIDHEKYGYTTDGEVRAEAKKAMEKFDKIVKSVR
jgi:hypothetical protein